MTLRKPLLLMMTAPACTPEVPEGPVELVWAESWALVPLDEDPFAPPADASCAARGVQVETGALEILTELCPWATLRQPLAADVAEGEALELFAFHGPLAAAEPALGVMALTVDGEAVWSVEVAIPSDDGVYLEHGPAPRRWSAGAEVLLHVHNHGGNDWRFAWWRRL